MIYFDRLDTRVGVDLTNMLPNPKTPVFLSSLPHDITVPSSIKYHFITSNK